MSKADYRKKLFALISKYLDGTASEQEKAFVERYYHYFDKESGVSKNISESEKQDIENRMLEKIRSGIRNREDMPVIPFYRKAYTRIAAAAVLLILIAGGAFYLHTPHSQAVSTSLDKRHDIEPGINGAILKLAGGKSIVLDTAQNGQVIYNAGNIISKTDSGVSFAATHPMDKIEYYTLITPRAHQEQLILADGTRVWLNAASSIRFPTAFTGSNRTVEVTGEAYFEVAKDVSHPFIVRTNDIQIKVLGTHFNLMAYNDESAIKTTLLEGAVKLITDNGQSVVLKPGEQARTYRASEGKIELKKEVNVEEIIAWKNNLFWFDNDDIKSVMRQLSRWYNVDIEIKGNIPDLFTGSIPRNFTFSKIFEVLQKTGSIHYKMEDKKIIVTP